MHYVVIIQAVCVLIQIACIMYMNRSMKEIDAIGKPRGKKAR